jgi:hypothetical protein
MATKKKFDPNYSRLRYSPEEEGYGNETEWRRLFNNLMGLDEAKAKLADECPWATLEIEKFVAGGHLISWREVLRGYRTMSMRYHTDNPHTGNIEKLVTVQAAVSILKNKSEYASQIAEHEKAKR